MLNKFDRDQLMLVCRTLRTDVEPLWKVYEEEDPKHRADTAWTKATKAVLSKLAIDKKYEPYAADRERGSHEFLLDMVWWERKAGQECAVFACETELGNKRNQSGDPQRVADDFEKLLSFKASLKLMIFDAHNNNAEEFLLRLMEYLRKYSLHIANETYVLWDVSPKGKFYVCNIEKDGYDPSLSFRELGMVGDNR